MKITTSNTPDSCLPQAPFPFQQTYATPSEDLNNFVLTLLAPFEANEASACIDEIVFKPRELIWYLRGLGISTNEGELNNSTLHAETSTEVRDLLECVLGQWIDFAFIPSLKVFAIYADHDEFTTVFTATVESLNSLRASMRLEGFKEIEGWIRPQSLGTIEERETDV